MGVACHVAYRARCSNTPMTRVPNDPALQVEGFFDTATSTATWRVLDPAARARAIVDRVPHAPGHTPGGMMVVVRRLESPLEPA